MRRESNSTSSSSFSPHFQICSLSPQQTQTEGDITLGNFTQLPLQPQTSLYKLLDIFDAVAHPKTWKHTLMTTHTFPRFTWGQKLEWNLWPRSIVYQMSHNNHIKQKQLTLSALLHPRMTNQYSYSTSYSIRWHKKSPNSDLFEDVASLLLNLSCWYSYFII